MSGKTVTMGRESSGHPSQSTHLGYPCFFSIRELFKAPNNADYHFAKYNQGLVECK